MITDEEKAILLHAAREAIQSLFDREVKISEVDYNFYPNLTKRNAGAFVTLTKRGQLRGCVGYLSSAKTLFDTVVDAAKNSAINDPRFSPVTAMELQQIDIEISVLSPPVPISKYEDIVIGEHGLYLEDDIYRAVLLPQVAVEHNYSTSQFLSSLCEKAGMERSAWMSQRLNIKVFTADVFSEVGKRVKTYERI